MKSFTEIFLKKFDLAESIKKNVKKGKILTAKIL